MSVLTSTLGHNGRTAEKVSKHRFPTVPAGLYSPTSPNPPRFALDRYSHLGRGISRDPAIMTTKKRIHLGMCLCPALLRPLRPPHARPSFHYLVFWSLRMTRRFSPLPMVLGLTLFTTPAFNAQDKPTITPEDYGRRIP